MITIIVYLPIGTMKWKEFFSANYNPSKTEDPPPPRRSLWSVIGDSIADLGDDQGIIVAGTDLCLKDKSSIMSRIAKRNASLGKTLEEYSNQFRLDQTIPFI